MKIILDEKDIEKLIKKEYSGVTNIDFGTKDITITLEMDADSLIANKQTIAPKTIPNPQPTISKKEKTPEEKAKAAVKAGAMVTGGRNRAMIRM